MKKISYVGFIGAGCSHRVFVETEERGITSRVELFPRRSQKIMNHSPEGFSWGYGGSGAVQLALAICLDSATRGTYLSPKSAAGLAMRHYQDFKLSCVTYWNQDRFKVSLHDVIDFMSRPGGGDEIPGIDDIPGML